MKLWQLHNHTPLEAQAQFLKDHTPASFWCVWVKAGFDIGPEGRLSLATDQPSLTQAPEMAPEGDVAGLSLSADSDLYLPKARTDVLLSGHATAPDGHDAEAPFQTGLSIGDWSKHADAHPVREWQRGRVGGKSLGRGRLEVLGTGDIPLLWSEAYGGTLTDADGTPRRYEDNPAGRGFLPPDMSDLPERVAAPRLFYPGEDWRGPKSRPRPIGFGPVAPHWLSRAALAGTFDRDWQQLRAPILPADHDPAWRQSAPLDSQIGTSLQGDELVSFANIRGARDFPAAASDA